MKERVHWKRMLKLWTEVGTDIGARFLAFPIIVCLVSIAHYCFALMHFGFEFVLMLFMKQQFKANLTVLHKKTLHTLSTI